MPYPDGVITRLLTFGPARSVEGGAPLVMAVKITASRSLTWNGEPLIAAGGLFATSAGDEASVELPVTDQLGHTDGAGHQITISPGEHTHTYLAQVTYRDAKGSRVGTAVAGPFFVPTDPQPLDLDDIGGPVDTGAVEPVVDYFASPAFTGTPTVNGLPLTPFEVIDLPDGTVIIRTGSTRVDGGHATTVHGPTSIIDGGHA